MTAQGERLEFRVPVHLSPTEYSRLIIESILNDVPIGDLLRDAYFAGSGQVGDD